MPKFLLFATLSLTAFSVAAQQQPPPRKPKAEKQESAYERRIRTEGAAGGTAPPPEQVREGVGAGAKPHMHYDQMDAGLERRVPDEVIRPGKQQ